MNIQRVSTGSLDISAASQIQRGAREAEKVAAKTAETVPAEPVTETQPTDSAKKLHPRLAAYADKIDARLSLAMEARDLSPRQKAALEQAKTHFHSMIQRLDDAYTHGSEANKRPIATSLQGLLADLAQTFNHVQSGGSVDIKG
jgi:hypothetical protein